jgi:polyphenol oxidase
MRLRRDLAVSDRDRNPLLRGAGPGCRDDWAGLAEVIPDWPVAPGVRGFVTGRRGGVSVGPWGLDDGQAGGLNLGARCGDEPGAVEANRQRLARCLPTPPVWLDQVHGTAVHRPAGPRQGVMADAGEPVADAAVTDQPGTVLAVLTADCLPVLLADSRGRAVGVAHAGWRGLAAGVLENTVDALRQLLPANAQLFAWLGPAISQSAFEVGDEVREALSGPDESNRSAFIAGRRPGKWQADLFSIARRRLGAAGVHRVDGGDLCTWAERDRFWSYRRCATSGRIASLIWIEPATGS